MPTEQAPLFFEDNSIQGTNPPRFQTLLSDKITNIFLTKNKTKTENNSDKNIGHLGRRKIHFTLDELRAAKSIANRKYYQKQKSARHFRTQFTGEQEWFTPLPYLDAVREVLGTIDLDPASNPQAQETVQAARYFTAQDNALLQAWAGKVFLNPPYTQPLIEHFVVRLVNEFKASHVVEAILLTHNYTDTKWFHVAESAATSICFTRGRIKFVDAHGKVAAPTQGQAFFYFGPNVSAFTQVFSRFGMVR